jgi:hypothetical protein
MGLPGHADLANGISDQLVLTLQPFNLSQLQHDLFGFVSLASHLLVLLNMG